MEKLIIDADLAMAVITYLNGRPHGEVRKLIDGMASLKPAPEPEPLPAADTPPKTTHE